MSSNKAVLHYFDGRGKAEIIRLTLAATGVEWEQVTYTERAQYEELLRSGKLLFSQMPLIEYEGTNMVQSLSTVRFFARRGNLMGDNPDHEYRIDCLFEGTRDMFNSFMSYGFQGFQEVLDKAKTSPTALPRYLPVYNQALKDNGSNGFLVGSKLSLADIGLLENVLSIDELIGLDYLQPYPEVLKFYNNIKSNERLSRYLSGPLRPRKNDERYVKEVGRVLNW